MLTIREINEISFGKAGFSGYKPEDVDNFIDSVVESFTQMEAEKETSSRKVAELTSRNSELQNKLSILAEKIESYRKDEDGIKDALIAAQVSARGTVKDADKKAEIILANADHQAKSMLSEAEKERNHLVEDAREEAAQMARLYAGQIEEKKKELEEVKKQVTAFRSSLLEMYKKHLDCINHIPSFRHKDNNINESVSTQEITEQEQPVITAEMQLPQQAIISEESPLQAEPIIAEQQPVSESSDFVSQESIPSNIPYREEPQTQVLPKQQPLSQSTKPIQVERTAVPQHSTNPMMQKVNYAQGKRRAPAPNIPDLTYASDDLTDIGINTMTFNSIPESLLNEKKTGYTNLEFGEGVDVTTR
ncbi:DivIVA domain-containing protein [Scatolibacter rhodanostii]|uniref:DivIVA domain-containing protein n=1 Tax=Scatolibacter rhodanostii TaxID=2014781 RepID=UPI000C06DA0B|nr:DivIVA domain-containing protein [Scatolibacter rhodanostii]